MPLPGSGQLSLGDIAGELGVTLSNVSLRSMSSTAGFSTPDSVSEFYGYGGGGGTTYTYFATYGANDPCNFDYYDIYSGSDGVYYTFNGTLYDPMANYASTWFEFLYYEPKLEANVYTKWGIDNTSTVLTDLGLVLSSC